MSLDAGAGWLAVVLFLTVWFIVQREALARSEAVTRACHELRGPLAAARLGLALGSRGTMLSPAQLRAIDSELGRATLALDDLARVRARRGKGAEVGMVDLCALLADSVEAWRASARAAGVALRFGERPPVAVVKGERARLAQAAGNLIANAIEHGGRHVEVDVSVTGGVVSVGVCDDGPGLPDAIAVLVRRARRGRGARGRGLAIAAGIAAVHGGRLRALPVERGAHLALELPVLSSGTASPPES
ncbi:MAG: ATP-binding protein [Solirubrobacteraceae bacterium]